ncbi:MAG: FHA domain-containing protein [Planctomycetes bacterium]|nr:FHA domain-containing protein [Planctomycetota bacterium]
MEGIEPDAHGFLLGTQIQAAVDAHGWSGLGLTVPVVVVSEAKAAKRADGSDLSERATLNRRSKGEDVTGGDPSRYRGKLAPLAKRAGNPFPNVISIGRATSCDVVLSLATVSKLQGYFRRGEQGWAFLDQRSLNGTLLNGVVLEANQLHPLKDGDELSIAEEVVLTFVLPASLAGYLAQLIESEEAASSPGGS